MTEVYDAKSTNTKALVPIQGDVYQVEYNTAETDPGKKKYPSSFKILDTTRNDDTICDGTINKPGNVYTYTLQRVQDGKPIYKITDVKAATTTDAPTYKQNEFIVESGFVDNNNDGYMDINKTDGFDLQMQAVNPAGPTVSLIDVPENPTNANPKQFNV